MSDEQFHSLKVRRERGVAFVTIDHPPLNLLDRALLMEFHRLSKALAQDDGVRAVVVESANPDYWIAHVDLNAIHALREEGRLVEEGTSFFQALGERFRTMPKATIACVAGRARGGGSELALAMDMIFAARGRAFFSQPEVMLGLLPGGSGTQRLPRRMGRARAMEAVLGCADFSAELAERYGWINRALDAEALVPFVHDLAFRIASFPAGAVALAKAAVNAADPGLPAGLARENRLFNETVRGNAAAERARRFLERGGQTAEGELEDLAGAAENLAEP